MNDLYEKSVLKLALIYAIIIAFISLFFSANLYLAATNEINRALDRQERQLQDRGFRQPVIDTLRDDQYIDAKQAIIQKLLFANVVIVVAGGVGSYLLARRTLQPIKEAHDAQQRFTSDASHELRTPLTVVISETEVALRDKNLTKQEAIEILSSNLDEIKAMAVLTDNLLTLTKNEKIAKENFSKLNARKLINSVVKKYKADAQKAKTVIKVEVDAGTNINAHEASLAQILSILLENAIKHSGQESRVTISAKNFRRHATISIKDNGPGISKENLAHVFDRFYQADSSRTKRAGYGLGLSIAQRLAHAQGFNIRATSKAGEGASFNMDVPLA